MVSLILIWAFAACGSYATWDLLEPGCEDQAHEIWYDGIDQDCDGNDADKDGDGFVPDAYVESFPDWRTRIIGHSQLQIGDCWDDANDDSHLIMAVGAGLTLTAALVSPDAADGWYDGVDANCDGADDFDQDGDGFQSANDTQANGKLGDDCMDGSPNDVVFVDSCSGETVHVDDPAIVNPSANETYYDGIDQNCDGADDNDADQDGYRICAECDDTDSEVFPTDDPEIWYDCFDQNCDGNDGDSDKDGYLDAAYPDICVDWKLINPGKKLGDCWDNEDIQPDEIVTINGFPTFRASEIHPDAEDIPYDGVDAACDGDTFEFDYDQDGFNTEEYPNRDDVRGDDCNDQTSHVNPGAEEIVGDEIDQNCNNQEICYVDADNDGFRPDSTSTVDSSDIDCSDNGEAVASEPTNDCNDYVASRFPGNTEIVGDNIDQDCDLLELCYTDADNDGYRDSADTVLTSADTDCNDSGEATSSDGSGDCNDSVSAINPGATEVCDASNTDEDCDGLADDNDSSVSTTSKTRYYKDDDNDTYGDSSDSGSLRCEANGSYKVVTNTDCDDAKASINPGATEVCDASNTDEDCDGVADDNDSSTSSTGKTTYYKDADSDTYGDKNDTGSLRCDVNGTYKVTNKTDCNDAVFAINPGAQEICDVSDTDEDCDSLADDLDPSVSSTGKIRYYKDVDGDTYGDEADGGALSCDGTSTYSATTNDDCDDTASTTNPGITPDSCWEGVDNDCDAVVDEGANGASCYVSTGGELVVSELFILGNASTDPQSEWFEVYNPHATRTVYMESMTITRQNTSTGNASFTVNEVIAVAPQDTVVFCYVGTYLGSDCDFEYGAITGTNFGLTQNSNTTIVIATTAADVASRTLDSVNYNGALGTGSAGTWPGVNRGYSYELKTSKLTATDNDSGANWCETTGPFYYSVTGKEDHGTPNDTNTCP